MLSLPARLRSLLRGIRRRDALNDDMEAEFRLHVEMRAEDLVRSGLTPTEAARQARLEFGSTESFKDRGRDARGLRMFDNLRFSALDVKLGGRMLVKHPGLTVVSTIAVAFAIAIGTVAFEVIKQALFPTIPLPNGDAIVALRNWNVVASGPIGPSRRDYALWKRNLTTVTNLGAIILQDRNVAVGTGAGEPVMVADVTASIFATTRVAALRGRILLPADERPDAEDVIVIGYEFWKNKLGGATDVVGRVIRVSGAPARIVGVMPRGYAFPLRNGAWRPLHLERLPEASPRLWFVFGRLAPGRTFSEANVELAAVGARTAATFPETHRNLRTQVISLPHAIIGLSPGESMFLGSMNVVLALLLALVCGNVALLLFARAASRQTEIVVRVALGASRGRIITQLFAEALVLCVVGATVGLVASNFLLRWLWAIVEGQRGPLPFWIGTSLSPATMLYAIGLTLVAATIAGVVPALKVTSGGVDARLRAMSSGGGGLQFGGMWTAIIVGQIALTVMVPLVTSFVHRDFVWTRDMRPGFAAQEFLTATLALDRLEGVAAGGDTTPAARAARIEMRYQTLVDRLQTEPGVTGITYANRLPLMEHSPWPIEMDSGPVAPPDAIRPDGHYAGFVDVDPNFFGVLGVAVASGRSLTLSDATQRTRAVLVNEHFVKQVLGGRDPVGRRLRIRTFTGDTPGVNNKPEPWFEIVGVVPDLGIRESPGNLARARFFEATVPKNTGPLRIAIHVRGDPQRFAPRLRELVAAIDPALRVINPKPAPHLLDADVEFIAFWYHLLVSLAGVVLVLSLAGVYAVTAFAVAKRTREIGVRVALGARPRQIILTVFKRAFVQIALGVAVGAISMVALLSASQGSRWDVIGRTGVSAAAITICCMLACIVPTRRALRIQPTEALKDEG